MIKNEGLLENEKTPTNIVFARVLSALPLGLEPRTP
jgi:hypothetical protein